MHKKNVVSVVGIGICIVSLFVLTLWNVPPLRLHDPPLLHYQYVLSPLNTRILKFDEKIAYPSVYARLYTPAYIFESVAETIDLQRKKSNQLLLATKRLAELDSWGRDVPVLHDEKKLNVLHKNKIVSQLMFGWQKNKPKLYDVTSYKNFNSWEASMARYFELMNIATSNVLKSASKEEPSADVIRLKAYLDFHRRKMVEIIYAKIGSESDQEYLQKISEAICDYFDSQLAPYLVDYDISRLRYSLYAVAADREYGIYDISIDKSDLLVSNPHIFLYLNTKLLSPLVSDDTNGGGKGVLPPVILFNGVELNASSKILTLTSNNKNIITNRYFIERYDPIFENYYYYINLPNEELHDGKYVIELAAKLKKPGFLQLVKIPNDAIFDEIGLANKEMLRADSILNEFIPADTSNHPFRELIRLTNDKTHQRFAIVTETQLSAQELKTISISVSPFIDTEISIEKVGNFATKKISASYEKISEDHYIIKLQNSSANNEQYLTRSLPIGWKIQRIEEKNNTTFVYLTFWPKKIAMGLIFLSILLLIARLIILYLSPRIMRKLAKLHLYKKRKISEYEITRHITLFLWNRSTHILEGGKYIYLTITLAWLFAYIFLYTAFSEVVIVILLLFWLITVVSFAVEARINFLIAFFLLITRLMLFNGSQMISEKLSTWTYIFLFFGTLQFILEVLFDLPVCTTQSVISGYMKLPVFSIPTLNFLALTKVVFYKTRAIAGKLYELALYFLKKYLNMKPITKRDYMFNGIKIVILLYIVLVIASITVAIILDINTTLIIAKNKRVRASLNGHIVKIEPHIVYYSTKVIIYGDNFDWKSSNRHIKLVSQYGEVPTDFWTDKRISFTIPLHWKPGIIWLTIEKPALWDGRRIIAKSSIEQIKLIPRGATFSPDDDLYFEQLKHLDKETLQLNGYK